MIAKILSAAASFNGVEYNEKKNEKGKSELLVAKNFNGLELNPDKEKFKLYLKAVAKTNPNVKKPQFHAIISCKNREYSHEELKAVAEKWMEKMGYGNQPYLIYAHSDTKNNHVHVVSVRVDENGNKISDSFERIRSQQALKEILGINYKEKAEKDFKQYSAYYFTTIAQFKLLFEQGKWNVEEKDGNLNLIKGGEVVKSVSLQDVNAMIERNKLAGNDKNRKKQITAVLNKYKGGLDYMKLRDFMMSKFGIELVFHKAKNHNRPYGYTLIDHKGKAVYKGSEIMDIKKILDNVREKRVEVAEGIVKEYEKNHIKNNPEYNLDAFKNRMKEYGYTMDKNGNLKDKDGKLLKIGRELLLSLNYNTALKEASMFEVKNAGEAAVISAMFHVKKEHLRIKDEANNLYSRNYYLDLLKTYACTGSLDDNAKQNIQFLKKGNTYYILDLEEKKIESYKESEINQEVEQVSEKQTSEQALYSVGLGVLSGIIQIIGSGGGGSDDPKRKRKKKQQQSI